MVVAAGVTGRQTGGVRWLSPGCLKGHGEGCRLTTSSVRRVMVRGMLASVGRLRCSPPSHDVLERDGFETISSPVYRGKQTYDLEISFYLYTVAVAGYFFRGANFIYTNF